MIEKTVLDYLDDELPVPVYMEVPEYPPKEYIVIEKTSGGVRNHIHYATLAIQSVSESLYLAAGVNEQVKAALEVITDKTEISKCDLNSDYNFTDTTTKKYRYQAVFDLVHY